MSDDVLHVGQSALYPALHKLERQGWVTSEWRTSETNRRARYYSLTEAGRDSVVDEAARWELDASVYLSVAVLLGAVAVAAGYVPARRATAIDPMRVLNTD